QIRMITPPAQVLDWAPPGIGPHSAVPVPGRPLLVVTEEIYPAGASTGCPWGHARLVDITDPSRPAVAGEYLLPENRQPCTGAPPATTFTSHNTTATHDL